ncbi:glycine-rich protein 2-like [Solanum lycopersicum]|uniref:glycine-rich protein 2-like n=1 Tax=Solanum lycopersicum TaxID=4081 RepID=UPI000532D8C8|nr:glycine-rich protein 2-like [Solanum lycopersicum]
MRFSDQKEFNIVSPDDGCEELFILYSSIISKDFHSLTVSEVFKLDVESGNDCHTKATNVIGPDGALINTGSRNRRGSGSDSYGGGGLNTFLGGKYCGSEGC